MNIFEPYDLPGKLQGKPFKRISGAFKGKQKKFVTIKCFRTSYYTGTLFKAHYQLNNFPIILTKSMEPGDIRISGCNVFKRITI